MQAAPHAIFGRITSSGQYIPVVDGIRFIAIIFVLLFHCDIYVMKKFPPLSPNTNIFLRTFHGLFSMGNVGVPIFFVLSGYILSRAYEAIKAKSRAPLKEYYLRRLARLEPTYIASMLLLTFAGILVGTLAISTDLFISFCLSIIYLHDIVLGSSSPINGVAWSLEIEAQFYLLFPLIFALRSNSPRRFNVYIALGIIVFSFLAVYAPLPRRTLLQYIQYFLAGVLFYSLMQHRRCILQINPVASLALFFSLLAIIGSVGWNVSTAGGLLSPWLILSLFFVIFSCPVIEKMMSITLFTVIGGMCYTIYLFHYAIISFLGRHLPSDLVAGYDSLNYLIMMGTIAILTVTFSALLFLLIERPTMHPAWVKSLWRILSEKA